MGAHSGTYDSHNAKEASLDKIISILKSLGVTKTYIKKLAPNDNSKNQPYFGGHLTDLSFLPTGELVPSATTSNKKTPANRKIKYTTDIPFIWFDTEGQTYNAPRAKLIYYPQYPEVRFSGFLLGSKVEAGMWMDPKRQGRAQGRWLILGVHPEGMTYGYLVTPGCNLSRELENTELIEFGTIFKQLDMTAGADAPKVSTKDALMAKLREIHEMGWVSSCRLTGEMDLIPYKAANGGGYTLEALLGISPNGFAEPDYLGWEVKQFGVNKFPSIGAKPTTLMTPEPDGGFYKDTGVIDFIRKYGYPDVSGIEDRFNFGGKHIVGKVHERTNLTLSLLGFDPEAGKIIDAEGCIALLDAEENITASWSFAKLMDHWKRKHSQAVYIPSLKRKEGGEYKYHYGKDIELGTGTNLEIMLRGMQTGFVYYDPGIKVENASSDKPKSKRRSQFRINHKQLGKVYKNFEHADLLSANS